METKKAPKRNPNKMNMPKFNLNLLYLFIGMMLIGLFLTNEAGDAGTKEVSYSQFQEYVRKGYIGKVIGYNDSSVEAFVKAANVKD
ncbi:MAG: ATP-dependent metallopeptidase FtsH/Yme1/Tma family protein, partial [Prevotellaceae bacterium]|nr:ATP-dependent metallopeptidase FtsH/Yme1/Tma family protein [Prevotellaceae bacterium]